MNKLKNTIVFHIITIFLTACAEAPQEKYAICASGTSEPMQLITVDTGNVTGATCILKNARGSWRINSSPGTTGIYRSNTDLYVTCSKPGYLDVSDRFISNSRDRSVVNLVTGGFMSNSFDALNNATYDYPATLSLPMIRKPNDYESDYESFSNSK